MRNPEQAAADFSAALHQDAPDSVPTSQQRVQLGLCLGLAHYALNQIPQCLTATRPALQLAATLPWPSQAPPVPGHFDATQAQALLERLLVALCAAGIHAFAAFGTLLGLVREGRLLANDKDLDVIVPITDFERTLALLPTLGWQPAWIPLNASNFRAFVHRETGVTLDILGYTFDAQRHKVIGGWWPTGRPIAEGRVLEFSDFTLVRRQSASGPFWTPQAPETLLAEMYGPGWRQPDPDYEGYLGAPALVNFTDFTRAIGYLRLLEAWLGGHRTRVDRLLDSLTRRDPRDPILPAWRGPGAPSPPAIRIGGTVGCFDLLHVGHLRFLQAARKGCATLKVGVCTDRGAWRSKQCRPTIPQEQRLELIRGLACVDDACLFEGTLAETRAAADWIEAWGVDGLFVSEDWAGSPRWLALEPLLGARGIRCVWLPYTGGVSSTLIRAQLKTADRPDAVACIARPEPGA
ncbi:adenylyltransferase/cytidyltransferase family protein [Thiocystis violascens]|uniref:Cytidyltransferase-related enzyme n=1 Tax=Thiocystis violascens (strain ATCC 17096 / DSM 198 / 6111) TaxID=765911 RepID=I3YAM9_THIV6|nr:adenylyltransferase/cytidyltransferase family protein [Thiocystis violascens]AFL74047.1 cytidyltransferase-related enzyme [Thiocystis violascens DSM 198]